MQHMWLSSIHSPSRATYHWSVVIQNIKYIKKKQAKPKKIVTCQFPARAAFLKKVSFVHSKYTHMLPSSLEHQSLDYFFPLTKKGKPKSSNQFVRTIYSGEQGPSRGSNKGSWGSGGRAQFQCRCGPQKGKPRCLDAMGSIAVSCEV